MKLIKVIKLAGAEFILKGITKEHSSLEGVEVVKVYSKNKNTDLKPFLSDNCLFMIQKELDRLN